MIPSLFRYFIFLFFFFFIVNNIMEQIGAISGLVGKCYRHCQEIIVFSSVGHNRYISATFYV
jgi:hypothetical protein